MPGLAVRRGRCILVLQVALLAMPSQAMGQGMRFRYLMPDTALVSISRDVRYGVADTLTLRMDVYRGTGAAARAPALIFFNWAVGAQRENVFYTSWARVAASKGLVAILPDIRFETAREDFQRLLAHLVEQGDRYGIDREAIAVYAGSGNVSLALPIVQDPALTTVKAAVMFYGLANVSEFRRDLPMLIVRAGLDRPGLNGNQSSGMTGLAARAVAQNAPVTVVNHSFGYHAFEIANDDAGTRDLVDQTLDFVKRATSSDYQAALRAGLREATAAAHVILNEFADAAAAYAPLVAERPDDHRLRLAYGEALLGDRQFSVACTEFEKLEGKGLGPRDLGLPAARACAQGGDADRAVAWLQSIPRRFLPPEIRTDAAFATLVNRADFRALFDPTG